MALVQFGQSFQEPSKNLGATTLGFWSHKVSFESKYDDL